MRTPTSPTSGDIIEPSAEDSSCARDGTSARRLICSAVMTCPSTTPPLISNLRICRMYSSSNLAGATGSVRLNATAVGPCSNEASPCTPTPCAARCSSVFFTTLYSTPAWRNLARNCAISLTLSPRKSVRIAAAAWPSRWRSPSTSCTFAGRATWVAVRRRSLTCVRSIGSPHPKMKRGRRRSRPHYANRIRRTAAVRSPRRATFSGPSAPARPGTPAVYGSLCTCDWRTTGLSLAYRCPPNNIRCLVPIPQSLVPQFRVRPSPPAAHPQP